MTEAEELELLELEAEEAAAKPPAAAPKAAQPEPAKRGKLEAGLRGAGQGFTLGFADEIAGGMGAAMQAGVNVLPRSLQKWLDVVEAKPGDAYRSVRDEDRADNRAARRDQTGAYLAGEVLGSLAVPVPGGAAAKGASGLARVGRGALQGAGLGGAYGLGASEADSVGGLARDTALGAGLGGAGGAVGAGLGVGVEKVRGLAKATAAKAVADAAAKQAALKEKAVRSAAGSLGGETASALKTFDRLHEIVSDMGVPEELRIAAQQQLDDPRFREALTGAYEEYIKKAPNQLTGLERGRAGVAEAAGIDVGKATERALANPLRKEVWPRVATLGHRMLPVALAGIGGAVGGPEGAAAGTGLGAALALIQGRPGVVVRNMLTSPAVRKGAADAVLKMVGNEPRQLSPRIGALVRALRSSPEKVGAAEMIHAFTDDEEESMKQGLAMRTRR